MARQFYTPEQDQWLRDNYLVFGKHGIVEPFNKQFNDTRTLGSLHGRVMRLGLTGNGEEYRLQMLRQKCHKPVGSEHTDKTGHVWIKTKDIKGRGKGSLNWEYKHHYVWRQHNGDIPEGHTVIFLDGDITNCELDNLTCVPNGFWIPLAKRGWRSTNKDLSRAAVTWLKLLRASGEELTMIPTYRDDTLCVYPQAGEYI